MATTLRILGPEFDGASSRVGFERVAEAVRQFSAHSREQVILVRSPFGLARDHFVIVWPKGAAFVLMYEQTGKVTGTVDGDWQARLNGSDFAPPRAFANPRGGVHHGVVLLEELLSRVLDGGQSQLPKSIKGIALFVSEGANIDAVCDIDIPRFSVATVDDLTRRTIYHQPNILKLIDTEKSSLPPKELQLIADFFTEIARPGAAAAERKLELETSAITKRRGSKLRSLYMIAASVVVIIATILLLTLKKEAEPLGKNNDTTQVHQEPLRTQPISVVLLLHDDAQLFVSSRKFATRSELDDAIVNGLGLRSLPSKRHELTLDSVEFAKGVFGYFKVGNRWRKGMLLQSFHSQDTFLVDNFLPPLP